MKLKKVEHSIKSVVNSDALGNEVVEELSLRDNSIQKLLKLSNDIEEKCEDFTVFNANNDNVRFNEQG